jgi:hypothetical protein
MAIDIAAYADNYKTTLVAGRLLRYTFPSLCAACEPPVSSPSLPISALPEIRDVIDGAEGTLKADISRIKKLLADPAAILPPPVVAFTLQEAKDALDLLVVHSRQLTRWQKDAISSAERAEVIRLQAIIPEIRPLIQRLIALATELDKRARTGTASPRKMWRH